MTAAARADAKENSIADVKPTKQAVIASYTRDHRAPTAALLKSPVGGWRWIVKIARASLRMREDRNLLDRLTDHKLSKGWAKRIHLKNGHGFCAVEAKSGSPWKKAARILCSSPPRVGTLDLGHASWSRLSWLLESRWR